MRYELTDSEWAAIKPRLPNTPGGLPPSTTVVSFNGMFWALRSGAMWRIRQTIGLWLRVNEPDDLGSLSASLFQITFLYPGFRKDPHGGDHEDGGRHHEGCKLGTHGRAAPIGENGRDNERERGNDKLDVVRHQ
jgi:hypothetical protein